MDRNILQNIDDMNENSYFQNIQKYNEYENIDSESIVSQNNNLEIIKNTFDITQSTLYKRRSENKIKIKSKP